MSMYEDSLSALAVPAETPEDATNTALNIAEAIGSDPFFVNPAEMEAVTTLIETLPPLLGVPLLLTRSIRAAGPISNARPDERLPPVHTDRPDDLPIE